MYNILLKEEQMLFRMLALVIAVLSVSGCASLQQPSAPNKDAAMLQSRVTTLESELRQMQDENAFLKQQLVQAGRAEAVVRMPNAREIQTALQRAGYYRGVIDGQIGSRTKDAVRKFQSANGLAPDGVVGSRTWELLVKYNDGKKQ